MIDENAKAAVVLVDTLYGGNLGAAARVMVNFGLDDLRLVRPAPGIFEDPQLKPMARGAALPILKNAQVFDTLSEAIGNVEIALGFTRRLGKKRTDSDELRQTVAKVLEGPAGCRIAAVFGSEDKGLSNEDLEKCHLLVRIPTARTLRSLNLSQAVGLFCYEWRMGNVNRLPPTTTPKIPATVEELEGFYLHLEDVLQLIEFIEEKSPARMMNGMRRIIARRLPDQRDVRIMRGVLSKVELAIKRAKAGQGAK